MGITRSNPLPVHYYCERCRKIQFVEGVEIGIDLPEKRCICGCEMDGQGFGLCDNIFWEKEEPDLGIAVWKNDYNDIKNWLCLNDGLKNKSNCEEIIDDELIIKRFSIGKIVVLCENKHTREVYEWKNVRKYKEIILKNYDMLLPCNRKPVIEPQNFYELIRLSAFFRKFYTEGKVLEAEEDLLNDDEKLTILEDVYHNDIYNIPVFVEEGNKMDDRSDLYDILIIFTRAYVEMMLDEIGEMMSRINREAMEKSVAAMIQEDKKDVHIPHVFIGSVPLPQECLLPNKKDYPNDKRILQLKEVLDGKSTYICIVGVEEEEISRLYEKMILLNEKLDEEWLEKEELITITTYKKIFWFKDIMSCKIFNDVYRNEDNKLITEQYDRIFESVAGNNLCISLNDSRGMICRLPYDMSAVAKKGTRGWKDFI